MWPTGMGFEAGDSLRIEVCGYIHALHEWLDVRRLWENSTKVSPTLHLDDSTRRRQFCHSIELVSIALHFVGHRPGFRDTTA
jgi:hypothetical protein